MAENHLQHGAALSKNGLACAIENAWGEALGIRHGMSILLGDLERGLCERRAVARKGGDVTLNFSSDSIGATLWLTSQIIDKVDALVKELDALGDRLSDDDDTPSAPRLGELERLIEAHRAAYDAWMLNVGDDGDLLPEGGKAEGEAMMALASYHVKTIEEARRKAEYLMTTRFKDDLDDEVLELIMSFVDARTDAAAA